MVFSAYPVCVGTFMSIDNWSLFQQKTHFKKMILIVLTKTSVDLQVSQMPKFHVFSPSWNMVYITYRYEWSHGSITDL
jgi:hypothetical protein